MPYLMSLDHDLGETENGMMALKWLYGKDFDIQNTEIRLHSDNWHGRKNMESYINSWIKST